MKAIRFLWGKKIYFIRERNENTVMCNHSSYFRGGKLDMMLLHMTVSGLYNNHYYVAAKTTRMSITIIELHNRARLQHSNCVSFRADSAAKSGAS